jgi:hypothetical protein
MESLKTIAGKDLVPMVRIGIVGIGFMGMIHSRRNRIEKNAHFQAVPCVYPAP